MTRLLLWVAAGLILGALFHLVIILILPFYASNDIWARVSAMDAKSRIRVLEPIPPGEPNPLGLDPEIVHAICQLDLNDGPAFVSGDMPSAFWSLGVFDAKSNAIYSTTNRAGVGNRLELGIFNPDQSRQRAEQQLSIEEGLLIIESPQSEIFIIVRLAPPYPAMRPRFAEALNGLTCGNAVTSGTHTPAPAVPG